MFLLRNRADFRALGIKRQRSSSSLSVLHIYTIGGEEKPWCVPSAAAINSLETPPVSCRLQGTLMGVQVTPKVGSGVVFACELM